MRDAYVRLIFAAAYIVVDIAYVFASTAAYSDATKRISGEGFVTGRQWAPLLAWTSMAIGWYFLAAPLALKWTRSFKSPWIGGALVGLVLGITVYGTFNFTLAAMFREWSGDILLRDMAWGTSWAIISLTAYSVYTNHKLG
jgi:uncharacterized membrane protein